MSKNQDLPTWLQVVASYVPILLGAGAFFARIYRKASILQHRVDAIEGDVNSFHSEFRDIRETLVDVNSTVSASAAKIDTMLALLPRL